MGFLSMGKYTTLAVFLKESFRNNIKFVGKKHYFIK